MFNKIIIQILVFMLIVYIFVSFSDYFNLIDYLLGTTIFSVLTISMNYCELKKYLER